MDPNTFRVIDLKELLRRRELPITGVKTELIARLLQFNPNVDWNVLAEEIRVLRENEDVERRLEEVARIQEQRQDNEEEGRRRNDEGEQRAEEQRQGEMERRLREAEQIEERMQRELEKRRRDTEVLEEQNQRLRLAALRGNDNNQASALSHHSLSNGAEQSHILRELEYLRRDNDLMRRETEILKREQELLKAASEANVLANSTSTSNVNLSTNGIQVIKELLPEFDPAKATFWKWKMQLDLLIENYKLNDNQTKILMSSRLKEQAKSWFDSKPEHLTMSSASLLADMKKMFDLRPGKVTLRQDFEARRWKIDETFPVYFHDKLILANQVPIADEELVDYIIDGIADDQLQDHARMMNFKSASSLLESFEKLNLRQRKINNFQFNRRNSNQFS